MSRTTDSGILYKAALLLAWRENIICTNMLLLPVAVVGNPALPMPGNPVSEYHIQDTNWTIRLSQCANFQLMDERNAKMYPSAAAHSRSRKWRAGRPPVKAACGRVSLCAPTIPLVLIISLSYTPSVAANFSLDT
jgi:hypothetical protein